MLNLTVILNPKITKNIIPLTDLCGDVKDALHIEIAKNEELWVITRDEAEGRVKEVYQKVMGERKFVKQFS